MSRKWPAKDIIEFIKLIDDPIHPINEDGSYNLSETQARAILELRLQRLTAIGVKEVTDELQELAQKIREFLDILRSRDRIMEIISEELKDVKDNFAVPRRSEVIDYIDNMEDEDLIEREDMVVTVTSGGYIKRTALAEYREQKRGGKGSQGMATKEDDVVTQLFVANTHTPLLFFTTDGMAYKLKTWRLPRGGRNTKGKAIVNILPLNQGVSIAAIMPVDAAEDDWDNLQIVFATSSGGVRRNALSDFTNVRSNGKIAMKLPEGVSLVNARICDKNMDFLLTTEMGKAIRFSVNDVRIFKGRDSTGVRGIKLAPKDNVVSMAVIHHVDVTSEERSAYFKMRRAITGDETGENTETTSTLSQERYAELSAMEEWILAITASGFGKRSSAHEYRVSGRGGQGIAAANLTRRDDKIVASFTVEEEDQIMLVTSAGQSIRCPVQGISRQGRSSSGVKVFDTSDQEEVVSVAWIAEQNQDEDEPDDKKEV